MKKQNKVDFSIFNHNDYLKEYYFKVGNSGDENFELLAFFKKAYGSLPKVGKMVEVGGGPTVYQLISAAPKVREIHFTDYLLQNLDCILSWKNQTSTSFDWKPFIKVALTLETGQKPDNKIVETREKLLKGKITQLRQCDIFQKNPLGVKFRGYYDLVSTNFCPESVTSNKQIWANLVDNISTLLKPHGVLIMTALKDAGAYRVGKLRFPAVTILEDDIEKKLKSLGFKDISINTIRAEIIQEDAKEFKGYKGIIFVKAIR